MSIVNDSVGSMAPPSSRASEEAAIGEPDSTTHAPSQPRPSVLHALSVKIEPSRVSLSSLAPAFISPSAVTNRNSPTRRKKSRTGHGRLDVLRLDDDVLGRELAALDVGHEVVLFRHHDRMESFPTGSVNKDGWK